MKRDMEFVREILLRLESRPAGVLDPLEPSDFPDRHEADVHGHLALLREAGLIDGVTQSNPRHGRAVLMWVDMDLTWAGHDFVAAAMNDTVWNTAKRHAGEMFKSLSVATLSSLLQLVVRGQVPGL